MESSTVQKYGSVAFFVLLLAGLVAGPCTAFWPPDRSMQFDNSIQWLSVYDDKTNTQTIGVELEFRGDARNFGITFASPSKPEVYNVDQKLFGQLRDITPRGREEFDLFDALGVTALDGQAAADVKVVEVKDVGDFTATVLRANSTEALTSWLSEHNYSYDQQNVQAFDHYVEKEGFHFIALKINTDEVECLQDQNLRQLRRLAMLNVDPPINAKEAAILVEKGVMDREEFQERFENASLSSIDTDKCYVRGKLKPFAVDYKVDHPTLFTRIMGQNAKKPMEITLYTAGEVPWYVPGSTVHYSQRVDKKDVKEAPAAKPFIDHGEWLTRSTLKIDFNKVSRDIKLQPGKAKLSIDRNDRPRVVNPELSAEGSGIVTEKGYNRLEFQPPDDSEPAPLSSQLFLVKDNLSGVANDLLELVGGFIAGILLAIPGLILSPLVLVEEPMLSILFIPPITLGLLGNYKKAGVSTFLGIAISAGAWMAVSSTDISLFQGTTLVMSSATAAAVIAIPSGLIFSRISITSRVQQSLEPVDWPIAAAAVAVIVISSLGVTTVIAEELSGNGQIALAFTSLFLGQLMVSYLPLRKYETVKNAL